jgi:hypothetical protein
MTKKQLINDSAIVPVESNPGGWLNIPPPEIASPPNSRTSYVTFVSNKSASFGLMLVSIPDLADGDPVLVQPEPLLPVKLSPFRFFWPGLAFQHWSALDESGQITETVLEDPGRDSGMGEHIEACILVIHGNALIPARCTFKTTKTGAFHAANEALRVASTPAWADISAAHRATLSAPAPWLRFTTTVTVVPYLSKSTGRTSKIGRGKANPSTPADWQMIGEFFRNEDNVKLTTLVQSAWERRVEEIKRAV